MIDVRRAARAARAPPGRAGVQCPPGAETARQVSSEERGASLGRSTAGGWSRSRRRALGGAAALAGAAGAACAGGTTGTTGTAGSSGAGARTLPVPRTVEYWSQWGAGVQLDTQTALLGRYQQLNPGVTVSTAVAADGQRGAGEDDRGRRGGVARRTWGSSTAS